MLQTVESTMREQASARVHATELRRQPARAVVGATDVFADTPDRTAGRDPANNSDSLLRLQRRYGNRYVQRVVELSRRGERNADVAQEGTQAGIIQNCR